MIRPGLGAVRLYAVFHRGLRSVLLRESMSSRMFYREFEELRELLMVLLEESEGSQCLDTRCSSGGIGKLPGG